MKLPTDTVDEDLYETFCCPITQELMVGPVAASDGHTVSCFPPKKFANFRVVPNCSSQRDLQNVDQAEQNLMLRLSIEFCPVGCDPESNGVPAVREGSHTGLAPEEWGSVPHDQGANPSKYFDAQRAGQATAGFHTRPGPEMSPTILVSHRMTAGNKFRRLCVKCKLEVSLRYLDPIQFR